MNRTALAIALAATGICGGAHAQTKFSLTGGEEPEQKAWTEPASFSFTSAKGARDSWALNVVGRIEGQPVATLPATLFAKAVVQKNTQDKKEVENYAFAAGSKFSFDTASGPDIDLDALYFYADASVGLVDKTIFPDPKAVCTAVIPVPADCQKQHETSWRAQLALQTFMSAWETTFGYEDASHQRLVGPDFTHSFTPVLTLFHDDLLDAKRDAAGVKPDGSVTGAKLSLGAAISPAFTKYRLVLAVRYEHTQAFRRSDGRRDKFQRSADLIKLSADYELGRRSFENGGSGWSPAVGVSYTKGDDPLAGKLDQDNVVLGFKLTYRSAPARP